MQHNDFSIVDGDLLDLNDVMRAFGVSAWENLGPDESTHGNSLSLLVEVQGRRYCLHERPEGLLGEDLSHRYAFRHYLRQTGIPIPDCWLTPTGEPAVMIGEDAFELQHWPAGELFSTDNPLHPNWIEAAGAMLGRIHQASRSYTGHVYRWPAEAHMGAMVRGWLDLACARADASGIQAVVAALSHCVGQWEAVLPAAMMSLGADRDLPELHIHGDYHAFHLRFDERGVSAVLGLEASRWEKRIFEVAYALFSFSALAWRQGESLARPLVKRGFDPECARHFLRGYSEYCLPARGEAALLTDALMIVAPVAIMNGPLEDLFYSVLDEALIEDLLDRLVWAASLPAWLTRVRTSIAEMWS